MRGTDTEREAETQAEGEAGSMQGAQCGTQSRVSRTTLWAEGGAKPLSHWVCPDLVILSSFFSTVHNLCLVGMLNIANVA